MDAKVEYSLLLMTLFWRHIYTFVNNGFTVEDRQLADSQTLYQMSIFNCKTQNLQTCKYDVRIMSPVAVNTRFITEHTGKLCKSEHFPRRYRTKTCVGVFFWTQCIIQHPSGKCTRAPINRNVAENETRKIGTSVPQTQYEPSVTGQITKKNKK